MATQAGWKIWMVSAALALAAPALAKQGSWPQSFHDSGHTGFNNQEKTLSPSNVAGLQLLWGQGQDNCQTFADAYDEGTIYLMGQESDCSTFNIQAIDAATGTVKWDVPSFNPGTSSGQTIAIGKGNVFAACQFGHGTGDSYTGLCAYSEADGHQVWQFSNPCHCLPESGMVAQPVYADGTVYFGYVNGGGTCGGDIGYIVAANAKTGAVRWTYVTGDCNSLSSAAPAVANGNVYFGCANHTICAVSQSDGSLQWQAAGSNDTVEALVVSQSTVYVDVCGTDALLALDATTGAQLWSNSTLSCNGQSMVSIAGGNLYYVKPGLQIDELRARNGNVIWTAGSPNIPTGAASVANGVVYVPGGPNSGRSTGVSAFDASTGTLLWNSNFSGDSYGIPPPPIMLNGVLYEANDSSCGSLCAYALPGEAAHREHPKRQ